MQDAYRGSKGSNSWTEGEVGLKCSPAEVTAIPKGSPGALHHPSELSLLEARGPGIYDPHWLTNHGAGLPPRGTVTWTLPTLPAAGEMSASTLNGDLGGPLQHQSYTLRPI